MSIQATQILKDRSEFINCLSKGLEQNDESIEKARHNLENLKVVRENIVDLGKKVEHEALIPLGANIYVNGVIKHTGEYFLEKAAHPNSYSVLETLSRTLDHLDVKIAQQNADIEIIQTSKKQALERIDFINETKTEFDPDYPVEDLSKLPQEISTEKGVALKVGNFYEIIEFVD